MSERPNAELLQELFETHKQMMYSIALNILRNTHDAEDAVQNAFLWIIGNLEKISPIPRNERGFYFANIIEHISINILNKRKKYPIEDIDIHQEINAGISVEKVAFERITIEEIKQIVRTMSETDRLLLRLCLFEGKSCKEIAEISGITESNARVSIHRARKRLSKLLKERGIYYEY